MRFKEEEILKLLRIIKQLPNYMKIKITIYQIDTPALRVEWFERPWMEPTRLRIWLDYPNRGCRMNRVRSPPYWLEVDALNWWAADYLKNWAYLSRFEGCDSTAQFYCTLWDMIPDRGKEKPRRLREPTVPVNVHNEATRDWLVDGWLHRGWADVENIWHRDLSPFGHKRVKYPADGDRKVYVSILQKGWQLNCCPVTKAGCILRSGESPEDLQTRVAEELTERWLQSVYMEDVVLHIPR